MQLGFASAILPNQPLEEVLRTAKLLGFDCVELMCWPHGPAERRYAGVTHIDAEGLDEAASESVQRLVSETGVGISALGYYPNPLAADEAESATALNHLRKLIDAAARLGVGVVNTFIGRDPSRSVDDNWDRFLAVWPPIVAYAESAGVQIGIENCPMYFTADEWPGGKNLATTPPIWRRMFEAIPSDSFGLNYDPSHFVWQRMDYVAPLTEFADRIFHVHAKDVAIDTARLAEVGVLATPLEYHSPRLPGRGEIDWPGFVTALRSSGYDGPVCVEVEDRDYEHDDEGRRRALAESARLLKPLIDAAD